MNLVNRRNQRGFTLVELLIVIAVLGIIAAISIPRMTGVTDSFRIKSDIESAKTIAKQVEVLVMEGNFKAPNDTDWYTVTQGTTGDFGEDFPEPQFIEGDFIVEVLNTEGNSGDTLVAVGYSEDISRDISDLVDDQIDYFGNGSSQSITSGELLFSKDIGSRIK